MLWYKPLILISHVLCANMASLTCPLTITLVFISPLLYNCLDIIFILNSANFNCCLFTKIYIYLSVSAIYHTTQNFSNKIIIFGELVLKEIAAQKKLALLLTWCAFY